MIQDNYYFDTINHVSHINDKYSNLYKKEDGKIYNLKEETNYKQKKIKKIDIPENTFLITEISKETKQFNFDKFDKIISITDSDSYGILGFQEYIERNNIKFAERIDIYNLDKTILEKILKLENIYNFEIAFEKIKNKLIENNFETEYK